MTYDMQTPLSTIPSHRLTFVTQIITHPIDQFSKVALLIAHNSLPIVQISIPDENAQKEFILKIEDYMNNMFQDTHSMLIDFCNRKGYTQTTSHALFTLLDNRYFILRQKPHYIIKQFSNDDKERLCWVCLRVFKKISIFKKSLDTCTS